MSKKQLKAALQAADQFVITAEFVPLPGHNVANFEKFLNGCKEKGESIPKGMNLVGVTIPQSPGGVASMSPADIYALMDQKNLWADLAMIPHVSCKDMNRDAIVSYLVGLKKLGIDAVLALTGDKPLSSQGVFEIESVGLIRLIKRMNHDSLAAAKPGAFEKAHQFYIAAAVSPFKYTEPSLMLLFYIL